MGGPPAVTKGEYRTPRQAQDPNDRGLRMSSHAESGPGSHVGSQRAGLSQTTADEGERVEAEWDSSKRPACDS